MSSEKCTEKAHGSLSINNILLEAKIKNVNIINWKIILRVYLTLLYLNKNVYKVNFKISKVSQMKLKLLLYRY